MTKFILHGGRTRDKSKENNIFWEEMFRGTKDDVNYLGVYFAREQKRRQSTFIRDNKMIQTSNPNKRIKFVLADEDKIVLKKQIEIADVIFFSGGEHYIEPFFVEIDLKKILDNKIVAGSSMGVYFLSTYYYRESTHEILAGSGLLPIKTICHYNNEMRSAINKLNDYAECLNIHTLSNGEVIILYN